MYKDSILVNKIRKSIPIPVFETSPLPMYIIDSAGIIVTINSSFMAMTGFKRNEISDENVKLLYLPEDHQNIHNQHNYFIKEKEFEKREHYILNESGNKIFTEETSIKFASEDGIVYRLVSIRNKEELRNGEYTKSILFKIAQITNANDSLEQIISEIQEMISHLVPADNFLVAYVNGDQELKIRYNSYSSHIENIAEYNNELSDFIKYLTNNDTQHLITGKQISELIAAKKITKLSIIPQLLLNTPLITKNGTVGVMVIQSYTDQDAYSENTKQIMEFISSQLSRVIERKLYEEELIEARKKAEESDKTKSAFLSQMSHEIRTPLNSILSFSALIKAELYDHLNSDIEECFEMIERGGRRLIRTFDLILCAAGVQKGEYKPDYSKFNLIVDILRPLVARYSEKAYEKGIDLSLISKIEETRIIADYSSLNQLFINIIDNAVKYTNKGKVDIVVLRNSDGRIQVDIVDTGVGISREFLPEIFEYFSQEEIGYTRSFDGNGLGLAIVKEFANINNLVIKVQSEKEIGTTFSVIF